MSVVLIPPPVVPVTPRSPVADRLASLVAKAQPAISQLAQQLARQYATLYGVLNAEDPRFNQGGDITPAMVETALGADFTVYMSLLSAGKTLANAAISTTGSGTPIVDSTPVGTYTPPTADSIAAAKKAMAEKAAAKVKKKV